MQCVLFESDNTCHAGIGVSAWNVKKPKDTTIKDYCKTENFVNCPRLKIFLRYTAASTTLKVEQAKS